MAGVDLQFSPLRSSSLAGAMAHLAVDSALRVEMGARGREKIGEYSPEAWAQGLIERCNQRSTRQRSMQQNLVGKGALKGTIERKRLGSILARTNQ